MKPRLAVFATSDELKAKATEIAAHLNIPLLIADDAGSAERFDLLVWVDSEGVGLRPSGRKAPNPVRIDFVSGSLAFRGQRAGHTRELVANAVGARRGRLPSVLDATAGLGRDAFVLAALGCEVNMVERCPVVSVLLRDALGRAQLDPQTVSITRRIRLHEGDAVNFMAACGSQLCPEVVYLDPMFPERVKSASVKKEMRMLQQLLGADLDAQTLFEKALEIATHRVVVKRPRIAPPINDMQPHHVVEGKAGRFDVYHVKALG